MLLSPKRALLFSTQAKPSHTDLWSLRSRFCLFVCLFFFFFAAASRSFAAYVEAKKITLPPGISNNVIQRRETQLQHHRIACFKLLISSSSLPLTLL